MTAEPLEAPPADLRLTEWTSCGGCAAKWGASLLTEMVRDMPAGVDPALLVGLAPFDDAAIYRDRAPDVALVSTTDFFPPLVDHPADFGAIAAANACSDVFAMGGRVVLAVNIAAFPEHFPRTRSARSSTPRRPSSPRPAARSPAATRSATPSRSSGSPCRASCTPTACSARAGARPGDVLVLSQADRHRARRSPAATHADKAAAIAGMRALNRAASEELQALGAAVHAVTDVTGYGLAGHGWEMAERGGVQLVIETAGLVAYPGAAEAAERGVRTGGDPRNRDYVAAHLQSTAPASGRGAVHGPADVRWAAGRGRSGRGRRARRRRVVARRHVEAGEPAVVLR